MAEIVTIYIPLLNEGVDVARPTQAIKRADNYFQVLPTENYDPSDEEWAFSPNSIVECVLEKRDGDEILIATRLIKEQ